MRYRPVLYLLLLVVVPAGAGSQTLVRSTDGVEIYEIDSGNGWKVLSSVVIPPASGPLVKISVPQTFAVFSASTVDEIEAKGILSAVEAQEVRDDLAAEGKDYRSLADTFVIHLEAASEAERLAHLAPKSLGFEKGCFGWQDPETWSDSWELNEGGDVELISFGGDTFGGDLTVSLPLAASVDVSVTYQVKKSFCVPYKFRLIEGSAEGEVGIDGSIIAEVQLDYVDEWTLKHNLFTLELGGFTVWLGPVPVYLEFELPLDIGIDAEVKATGSAELEAVFNATASFDVTCDGTDCDGETNFEDAFDVLDPVYEFTLDANAKIWARAAIDMIIYDRDWGVVSVSATGYAKGHLFGYLGNQCGDLDGDGSGDTIEDLVLDVDVGYSVDASTEGLLLPDEEWNLLGDEWHLFWWDLWEDGEGWNLVEPLITGPQILDAGEVAAYEFSARPCYPYVDELDLEWTGPVTGSGSLIPPSGVLSDAEIPPVGGYTLTAMAVGDAHGREFGVASSLPVSVLGDPVLPPGVPTTDIEGGAGSEALYSIEVPAEATDLSFELSGGTGNADLYVRFDAPPSTSVFDCGSTGDANDESCPFAEPQIGFYYAMVYGSGPYSGVSLVANYTDPSSEELMNGVPVVDLGADTGSYVYYTIEVPQGATDLNVEISGGSGDADLYVRFGGWPSLVTFDCRSWAAGNGDSCFFPDPLAGTYHVLIYGYSDYSGVSLEASHDVPIGGGELENGVPKTDLFGDSGSRLFYTLEVPPGTTDLRFDLFGGSGDADLFVRFGSPPTTLLYDCHSWDPGNDESCAFSSPQPGVYHVMVYGYSSYSGASLLATYTAAVLLHNGEPVCDLAGDEGSETFFIAEVPENVEELSVHLSGGTGDADLYVRFDAQPTRLIYDCRSWNADNNESCSFPAPEPGRYHILVFGYSDYSGACLESTYGEPPVDGELINGTPVIDLAGATGSELFFTLEVPPGVSDLDFDLVGGSGDADLYVRFGLQPSTSTYDCRSSNSGNADSCSFAHPEPGTYYVLVYGYTSYSGASLTASYPADGGELSNGVPERGLEGTTDSATYFTLEVPAGATELLFELSGGEGDADLYVRFGSQASPLESDCESGNVDNNEVCSFSEPRAGTYHVLIYADIDYSQASLVGSYVESGGLIFSDGFESGDTMAWPDRQP